MPEDRSHTDRIGNHRLHPETLMLGYGYDPALSEGSVKPPVFLTSTFVFRSAEEGRLLRLCRRPQGAADARLGRAGLFALQPSQQRGPPGVAGRT